MKYNVSGFRKNIRPALNAAEEGRDVIIERHGVEFAVRRVEPANRTITASSVPPKPDVKVVPTDNWGA